MDLALASAQVWDLSLGRLGAARVDVLRSLHFLPIRSGVPFLHRCRAKRGHNELDEAAGEERAEPSLWVLGAA